jgi:glycosyltransferase involved in cell wall biosynthesis
MTPLPKVECLVKRWQHHTASGGFDRLAREVGAGMVQRTNERTTWAKVLAILWRRRTRTRSYMVNYQFGDYLAEWRMLWRMQWRHTGVVHALYGDDQMDLLLRRRNFLPCPLVATFHLPTSNYYMLPERFGRVQKHLVTGLDAAVVVSKCQLADFGNWFGPEKVIYVPHGIDTAKFCPGPRSGERFVARFVMVGDHLRDWETMHRVVDECHARKLPVRFDVVARRQHWSRFTGCANTFFHEGISEDKLLELYREAEALLVPVEDATANNAALEALACGTPVISNAVGGIPDYVDQTCGWIFRKGEVNGIVELIAGVCANPEIAGLKRAGARKKSLEFDWARVVEQMQVIYRAVAQKKSPALAFAEWDRRPLAALASQSA